MTDVLDSLIHTLEQDRSLEQPACLRERIDALERLDDVLVDMPADITPTPVLQRALTLHTRLSNIQQRLCEAIRHAIRQGAGAHALRGWANGPACATPGYDHLDALVGEVLAFEDSVDATLERDAEMVFYQPTPARHVFDLIERANINDQDVLVDLGSGLGHVPLLVSICTGARCIGVERDAAYVDAARRQARALDLRGVEFIAADARDADLSQGTVFYLYTPFTGGILREVLDRLREQAGHRDIRIATFGPCTAIIANEPWLTTVGVEDADRIAVFRPRKG